MKITLYMATTIDGFIAKNDGDSDWVSPIDTDNFMAEINKRGCIIVGRTTYDQFLNDLYPIEGVINVVVTSHPEENNEKKMSILFQDHLEILSNSLNLKDRKKLC